MARRKAATPHKPEHGALILPRHLADPGCRIGEELRAFAGERRAWLTAHGIDPANWAQVYPVLLASWEAHDIPSRGALHRARLRMTKKGRP